MSATNFMDLNMLSFAALTKLAKTFPDRSREREKVLTHMRQREDQHWHIDEGVGISVRRPRRVNGSNGLFTNESYAI